MKYGFIYEIFKAIIQGIKYLSLVELFKVIASKLNPKPSDEDYCKAYRRTSVDIFIILKWILIIILFAKGTNNLFCCLLTWYFIITNIHTYFYFHVWDEKAIKPGDTDDHSLRRRFIHLLLAISFSNYSFAYLYATYYASGFNWSNTGVDNLHSIWFSISNSVAANYSVISPKTDLTNSVTMWQLLLTFIFVAIIVSRSIPQKS